jgi:hypothetical protein
MFKLGIIIAYLFIFIALRTLYAGIYLASHWESAFAYWHLPNIFSWFQRILWSPAVP